MICNGKWGNDMEEQTGKLLKECSSGCKMAINSLNQVRDFVKDEKLHQLLDEYDKKHKCPKSNHCGKDIANSYSEIGYNATKLEKIVQNQVLIK